MPGNKLKGFTAGIISSAAFGFIPLFSIPVRSTGMVPNTMIFYRFLFAACALAILMLIKKESFRLQKREIPSLGILCMFYCFSSVLLLWGYDFMPSGIATTIHFLYPVIVTLVMIGFFHERGSLVTYAAVALAVAGVYLLSAFSETSPFDLFGFTIVFLSGVAYALYIVGVKQTRVRMMTGMKLTFYVMSLGAIVFLITTSVRDTFMWIPDTRSWFNLVMLAIIPTVVSNLALVYAIRHIGSTLTSVLGAMEPLTAVCIGIIVFNDPFTAPIAFGILAIITAVSLIILSRPLENTIRQLIIKKKAL